MSKTLNEVLTEAMRDERTHFQVLPEVMTNIRLRTKPHKCSEVSFVTTNITPSHVAANSEPYIGIICWIPRDIYPKV